jgi:hypothetical protein
MDHVSFRSGHPEDINAPSRVCFRSHFRPLKAATRERMPLGSRNGDDDALGRGTHGTSEGAQIKAGLILLEKRKDHRSVAVRAERALIGSFAVEKRGNGTIEHRRLRQLGGSAILSVTDICRGRGGGAIIMRFGLAVRQQPRALPPNVRKTASMMA